MRVLWVRMLHEVMDHDLEVQIGRKGGRFCNAKAVRRTGASRAQWEPGEPEISQRIPLLVIPVHS